MRLLFEFSDQPPVNTAMAVFVALAIAVLSFGVISPEVLADEAESPAQNRTDSLNVVLILLDDVGWSGLGCYGSTFFETPKIDQLARRGMRFTDAYATSPICSPSRASLLTGQYPASIDLTNLISGNRPLRRKLITGKTAHCLRPDVKTLAQLLGGAGYATASIGKWHLGGIKNLPEHHGFDLNVGGAAAGGPGSYFHPYGVWHLREAKKGQYLTDRLTDEAVAFIDENQERPFFLYLSHFAVHTPLEAPQELVSKYEKKIIDEKIKGENAVYGAMTESLDQSVGRVVSKLEETGLTDRTVILLTSDNGALQELRKESLTVTTNAPLRGGKGTLYEGGLRVPLIIVWPGVVLGGSQCSTPVTGVDHVPTILDILGKEKAVSTDGRSLVPLLKETESWEREALFWHFPHYSITSPAGAIRAGHWKLIEYFEDDRVELYNLALDLGEKTDLAGDKASMAADLLGKLRKFRERVGARMPESNPDYRPGDSGRSKKPKKG